MSFFLVLPSNSALKSHSPQIGHLSREIKELSVQFRINKKGLGIVGERFQEALKENNDAISKLESAQATLAGIKDEESEEFVEARKLVGSLRRKARAKVTHYNLTHKWLNETYESVDSAKADLDKKENELKKLREILNVNKTGDFIVNLPEVIELKGEGWEVGLVEATVPLSWLNIDQNIDSLLDFPKANNCVTLKVNDMKEGMKFLYFRLPPAYYETPQLLVDALNTKCTEIKIDKGKAEEKLVEVENFYQFQWDDLTKRISISVTGGTELMLNDHLCYIMGFDKEQVFADEVEAKYPPDIRAGIDHLYLYCDIVEPQIVGDTKAPLLRCVPVKGRHGDIMSKSFQNTHYLPLAQTSFSSIRININGDNDKPIPFLFGKSMLTLHFKQTRKTLL